MKIRADVELFLLAVPMPITCLWCSSCNICEVLHDHAFVKCHMCWLLLLLLPLTGVSFFGNGLYLLVGHTECKTSVNDHAMDFLELLLIQFNVPCEVSEGVLVGSEVCIG